MTRLLIMRHAKSSWKEVGSTDHQRPLNKRGRRDAPEMARQIVALGWAPSLALVSDAARTEETYAWMSDEWVGPCRHTVVSAFYHGSIAEILPALAAHAEAHSTVMVLGHNPGWEDAVHHLVGRSLVLRTANVALVSHPEPWAVALTRQDWTLEGLLTPT